MPDKLISEAISYQWDFYERTVNNYSVIMRLLHCLEKEKNLITHGPKILVEENDIIVVEKLQIRNMIKNHHLAKSISDAGWGQFIQILKYKAENAGKEVIEVNPKGTSQTCSVCGNIVKKDLSIRIHNCPFCSSILNRDYNAALNILQKAWIEPSVLACT